MGAPAGWDNAAGDQLLRDIERTPTIKVEAAKPVAGSDRMHISVLPTNLEHPWASIHSLGDLGTAERFPIEELPQPMRSMIEAVAETTATPVDLAASVALGVLAVLASRGVSIRPTGGIWTPPANIYVCCVITTGEGKTPVFRELTGPLYEIQAELVAEGRPGLIEAKTRRAIADQIAEKAAKDVLSGKGHISDAVRFAQEADLIQIPPSQRILTMEPTPEALVRICSDNGGTLGVLNDEGAEVFQLASRYSANGAANLGVFLEGFDGGHHVSDRASRESLTIPRLVLSMVLAVQPSVLDELARDKANRDRGLLGRFLLCMPTSQVGSRPTRRPEVPSGVRSDWNHLLRTLSNRVLASPEPTVLELDSFAQGTWWKFCEILEPRLHPDTGDLRYCVDWGNKGQGHVARLAALLHVGAEHSLNVPVQAATMRSASVLWEYFAAHAKRVFGVMSEPDDQRIARRLARWFERTDLAQFSQRDAWKGVEGGIVVSAGDVQRGLKVLRERGYVREVPPQEPHGPGRPPSTHYEVNPALRTAKTAKILGGAA